MLENKYPGWHESSRDAHLTLLTRQTRNLPESLARSHPFPGLMFGSESQYVAGLYVEAEESVTHGLGLSPLGHGTMNLMRDDSFEVVKQ
jgi:hypothetical protein